MRLSNTLQTPPKASGRQGIRVLSLVLVAMLALAGCGLLGGDGESEVSEGTSDNPVDLGSVGVGASKTHEGSLSSTSSFGYYEVGVSEGQEYSVTVSGLTAQAAIVVFSDEAMDQRVEYGNSEGNAQVTVTFASTGITTAYIQVSVIDDTDFTLEVTHTGAASSS